MNYALSWYLGLSHGLREGRSNRRTVRRSLWRAARAALRGTLHSRGSSATADLPRADRLFSIENLPVPLFRPPAHGLLLFLRPPSSLLARPARFLLFPPSTYLAPVSRFVEPSAPCHPTDDDSMLSLTESRESESPARSGGCCETAAADHTGRANRQLKVHTRRTRTRWWEESCGRWKKINGIPFLWNLRVYRVVCRSYERVRLRSANLRAAFPSESRFPSFNITLDDESMSKRAWKCTRIREKKCWWNPAVANLAVPTGVFSKNTSLRSKATLLSCSADFGSSTLHLSSRLHRRYHYFPAPPSPPPRTLAYYCN